MSSELASVLVAACVMCAVVWIATTVLIWRLASSIALCLGKELRAKDRERHDAIGIAERVAEKFLVPDARWAANIHANERDRIHQYDASLEREDVRAGIQEDDSPPPRPEFATSPEEAMQ